MLNVGIPSVASLARNRSSSHMWPSRWCHNSFSTRLFVYMELTGRVYVKNIFVRWRCKGLGRCLIAPARSLAVLDFSSSTTLRATDCIATAVSELSCHATYLELSVVACGLSFFRFSTTSGWEYNWPSISTPSMCKLSALVRLWVHTMVKVDSLKCLKMV